jgi:hypothetical protein
MSDIDADEIYTILPVAGGFEATWGFKPSAAKPEPKHQWTEDKLIDYYDSKYLHG